MPGRWFSSKDESPGSPDTMLLTYGYWRRKFGVDPAIVGRPILVRSRALEVIGVLPRTPTRNSGPFWFCGCGGMAGGGFSDSHGNDGSACLAWGRSGRRLGVRDALFRVLQEAVTDVQEALTNVQEALTNVAQYANATQVSIRLAEEDGILALEIREQRARDHRGATFSHQFAGHPGDAGVISAAGRPAHSQRRCSIRHHSHGPDGGGTSAAAGQRKMITKTISHLFSCTLV